MGKEIQGNGPRDILNHLSRHSRSDVKIRRCVLRVRPRGRHTPWPIGKKERERRGEEGCKNRRNGKEEEVKEGKEGVEEKKKE